MLTVDNFAARLAQAKLATKADIADFVKEADFDNKLENLNKKVTSNKAKHVLIENELHELSEKANKKIKKRDNFAPGNENYHYFLS